MARWHAWLVLAALAFANNVKSGVVACGYREWQCSNEECIDAQWRCDGVFDCPDRSDEEAAMCDRAPSIWLQEGQVTTVRAEYKTEHFAVDFHLCGGTSCSKVRLLGCTPDGALWYNVFTDCNARGGECSFPSMNWPEDRGNFNGSSLFFKAERRPSELAVWLDGHEDKAVTVLVEEGSDLLRVRPWKWSSNLAVQFELWCANGGTLSGATCICKPGFVGASCEQVSAAPHDVDVYRWNRTHVFINWRPPALPGGQVFNYNVSVAGLPSEKVSPDSMCPAWSNLVCHVTRRPKGNASNPFPVVVVATDGDQGQRGDEARVAVVALDSNPDAVVDLQASPRIDSVLLTWRLPRHLRGDLKNFGVWVTRLEEDSDTKVEPDPDPLNLATREELPLYEFPVTELQPGTTYRATVRCDATGGSTAASVLFTTNPPLG